MLKERALDPEKMVTREQAHEFLKEKFSFPDYYGKNLDALYDCLTEISEPTLIYLCNCCPPEYYFHQMLPVFEDAAEENENLLLCYEHEDEYLDEDDIDLE